MEFNFIATNNFDLIDLSDINLFINNYPDFQTVVLNNEKEFFILLDLIGVTEIIRKDINNDDFNYYWNISNFKFPEFDEQQFDEFYIKWIDKSQRENNMDEYGNLIFLCGLSLKWNKLKYRLVVQ